jgi:hypothetical protein
MMARTYLHHHVHALGAIVLLMLALLFILHPASAHAEAGAPSAPAAAPAEPEAAPANAAEESRDRCRNYGTLVGAVVPCVINIISETGVALAKSFRTITLPIFYAFLTLVIIFFGVKISLGAQSVGKDAFLLLIKIAFVIGFIELLPDLIPSVAGALRNIIGVIAMTLADPADFNCNVSGHLRPQGDLLWAQMDCILGKLFGYTFQSAGSNEPNMLMAASAFGALGGFLFSGAVGFFVFMGILGMLINLFMMIIRTVGAYINGFILVTLLIMLAPIFLPLGLLQQTTTYFDKWWRSIFSAMLLPVLVSTYFVIAMLIYDTMLFKPDSMVKKLFDAEFMQQVRVENQASCGPAVVQNQSVAQQGAGMSAMSRLMDPNIFNRVRPMLSGNNLNCVSHAAMRIGPQEMERLFIQLIQLLILVLVLQKGFTTIQEITSSFGSRAVSATLAPVSTQEKTLEDAFSNMRQGILGAPTGGQGTFAQASGTDFIRAIPGALTSGVQGFMGTFNDGRLR